MIAARRRGLQEHDRLTHLHWERWWHGEPTPAAASLEEVWALWEPLPPGEWMTVEWDLPQHDGSRYAKHSDRPPVRRR